jgi:hypothetical protein
LFVSSGTDGKRLSGYRRDTKALRVLFATLIVMGVSASIVIAVLISMKNAQASTNDASMGKTTCLLE